VGSPSFVPFSSRLGSGGSGLRVPPVRSHVLFSFHYDFAPSHTGFECVASPTIYFPGGETITPIGLMEESRVLVRLVQGFSRGLERVSEGPLADLSPPEFAPFFLF
jgi:non-ribosomal peptide synthetase component F